MPRIAAILMGNPEYRKLLRQYQVARFTLMPLLCLSVTFVAVAFRFLEELPQLLPISIGVFAAVIALFCVVLKRLNRKETALRESVGGIQPELTATNPLFQTIIEEYEDMGLEPFINDIILPGWKTEACTDYNGIITIILIRKDHEIAIDLSDTEVTLHFDEEGSDIIITEPLTTEAFSDINELTSFIRTKCSEYDTEKRSEQI